MLSNLFNTNLYSQPVGEVLPTQNQPRGKLLPQPESQPASGVKVDLSQSDSLKQLAQSHNLTRISPQQVQQLADDLFQQGHISLQNHSLLSSGTMGGHEPDPQNLLSQWQMRLDQHQQNRQSQLVEQDRQVLNILGNLASLREQT